MIRPTLRVLLPAFAAVLGGALLAAEPPARSELDHAAVLLEVNGGIGPATADFLKRGLLRAQREGAVLVVLRINTPGGLDAATRDIDQAILASTIPVVSYVAPEGARAASAGTFIVYASHIAAMAPATNLGAATPVGLGGGDIGRDEPGKKPDAKDDAPDKPKAAETPAASKGADNAGDKPEAKAATESQPRVPTTALGRKIVNDAVAHIRSLAELRGRDADFAEDAVRNAATLTAREAFRRGVVDLVAHDLDDLLQQLDGREVAVGSAKQTLHTKDIALRTIAPDWRNQLLSVITEPTIAYLLLLIGLYGLVFEGYHPGAVLPGVVGAIALLVALYALQVLPVNYAGLALIVLGIAMIVAETLIPGFGVLGFGGIVALVVGSIMLLDVDLPGYSVSRGLIYGIAASSAIGFALALRMATRARRQPVVTGTAELLGQPALALEDFAERGRVRIRGEIWQAATTAPVRRDQALRVVAIDGLVLRVAPRESAQGSAESP